MKISNDTIGNRTRDLPACSPVPPQTVPPHTPPGRNFRNPITGPDRPRGFQEVESIRFQDNRHMKVVGLSALRTGRLYPSGNIPGIHFC